jgi:hypothetical protein
MKRMEIFKKEKFYELISVVQNAIGQTLGVISLELRDQVHQLYEDFEKEVKENIAATGYNDLTYVYLTGLFFEFSEFKRRVQPMQGDFIINSTNLPAHSDLTPELKKNTALAFPLRSCLFSN